MTPLEAHRAIATLHSFRFFGLVFIIPGVVGHLPSSFAAFAAYGDFATGLLALLALATVRVRPLFWSFVVAFNLVGVADIVLDYFHAIRAGLPAIAGQMGAAYFIPILYVPLLMITSSSPSIGCFARCPAPPTSRHLAKSTGRASASYNLEMVITGLPLSVAIALPRG